MATFEVESCVRGPHQLCERPEFTYVINKRFICVESFLAELKFGDLTENSPN